MRASRRMALYGAGAREFDYTYTGQSYFEGDAAGHWALRLLTSGTLTIKALPTAIDVFAVGGGGGAGTISGGAGGGYTAMIKNKTVAPGTYAITVGAGGAQKATGGTSSGLDCSAAGGVGCSSRFGGAGGSGGGGNSVWSEQAHCVAGSDGSDGGNGWSEAGKGQGSTTRAFGEATWQLFSGAGAGYCANNIGNVYYPLNGGDGGGGNNGLAFHNAGGSGIANTGGGGGGGHIGGGAGGSGIVWLRDTR